MIGPRLGDVVTADRRSEHPLGVGGVGHDVELVAPTHHTMMSSSTDPSASSSRWVYWARPGAILPRSLVRVRWSAS